MCRDCDELRDRVEALERLLLPDLERPLGLAPVEGRVLRALLRVAPRILSRDQLIALAWRGEERLDNTVATCVSRLRKKGYHILTEAGVGYYVPREEKARLEKESGRWQMTRQPTR